MVACHLDEPGDSSAGRKYTDSADQTIDMWHAKYVRSLPMGMFDDQYVDNNTDPKKNKGWGRKGDTGKGGYKNNDNGDKSGPAFMNLKPTDDELYYVIPSKKVPFVDNSQINHLYLPENKKLSFLRCYNDTISAKLRHLFQGTLKYLYCFKRKAGGLEMLGSRNLL